jgi:hypothetical protein
MRAERRNSVQSGGQINFRMGLLSDTWARKTGRLLRVREEEVRGGHTVSRDNSKLH